MSLFENFNVVTHHSVLFCTKEFSETGLCILAVSEDKYEGAAHKAPGGTNKNHPDETPFKTLRRKGDEEAKIFIKKARMFFKEEIRWHKRMYFFVEKYSRKIPFVYPAEVSNGAGITAYWLPIREFVGDGLWKTQRSAVAKLVCEILPEYYSNFANEYADVIERVQSADFIKNRETRKEVKPNILERFFFSPLKDTLREFSEMCF